MALTAAQTKLIAAQSAAYAKAQKNKDDAGMLAANKAANAIRSQAGVATQYSNAGKPAPTPTPTPAPAAKSFGAEIFKADGTSAMGYNSGGQTFYANGSRVGVGDTVVSENGKYYLMTDKGGVETSRPQGAVAEAPMIPGVTPSQNPANMVGAAALAKLYGITTDRGTIEGIYNDATAKSFGVQQGQQKMVANQFMDSIFTGQQTQADIIRKSNAAAVATGASRGMQAAQEMSALLQNSQVNAAGATNVAQTGAMLNDKEQAAMAQNAVLALQAANSAGTSLAGIDAGKYAADTQYGVGALDSNARNYTADTQLKGTLEAANINAKGQADAARINAASYKGGSSYNANGTNPATGSDFWTDYQNALRNKQPSQAAMILKEAGIVATLEEGQAQAGKDAKFMYTSSSPQQGKIITEQYKLIPGKGIQFVPMEFH